MARDKLSLNSLMEASRGRAQFSGHGNAKGARGHISNSDRSNCELLGETGQVYVVNPKAEGFEKIRIGGSWQNVVMEEANFFQRLFGKVVKAGVDLDLGCLYELENGERGAVQAFGEMFGSFEGAPYIQLSGDDRTGCDDDDDDGEDETLRVNGREWHKIRRILIYFYIYDGANCWSEVRPEVIIRVPGEPEMVITPHTYESHLAVCAVAGIENLRGGIKITNYTEYYPGHAEMDRAHGYGLHWEDGKKS
jgi:tellurite resistance protein TerA